MPNIYRSVMSSSSPPAVLQSKTVTAGTSDILVEPDVGYDGLSDVTVEPTPSQSKSATPTTSAQTISPDSGKLLSQVDIAPIPSQYKIPTQIMPGNTPGAMTAGEAYSPVSNAYIIKEYREIYPNDAYPAAIYTEMLDAKDTGYAIRSYSSASKTPSPTGEYFASGWNRMTSAGYAYASPVNVSAGTITATGAGTHTVTLGFKPKYIAVAQSNAAGYMCIYDERYSTSGCMYAGTGTYSKYVAFTSSTTGVVKSITDTGFTYAASSGSRTYNYFAIG